MTVTAPFSISQPIRFTHTDPASYVFYPRYFEMIQATVEDWFTFGLGIRYADFIASGYGLPTAKTECEFLKPSRLGEDFDLTVTLKRLGNSSIDVAFTGGVGGEERLRARSVLVQISLGDGRPRPIEGELRDRLQTYLEMQNG